VPQIVNLSNYGCFVLSTKCTTIFESLTSSVYKNTRIHRMYWFLVSVQILSAPYFCALSKTDDRYAKLQYIFFHFGPSNITVSQSIGWLSTTQINKKSHMTALFVH
jgi:hypothetical protein